MSYTTSQSASFTGTNGTLLSAYTNDNPSGGSGTIAWTGAGVANWTIQSNRAVITSASASPTGLNTTGTDMRVSGIKYGTNLGVLGRYDSATGKFYLFDFGGTNSGLYYYNGATFTGIAIEGVGPDISDGHEMAIVCNGTTITAEYDGVQILSATGQSQIASGKPAMYAEDAGSGFDSFKYETGTAGGATPTQLILATSPVGNQSGVAYTTQPVVNVADAGAATVTSDTSTVTAAITVLTGSVTLSGTTTKAAVAGVANFSGTGLKVTGTGSYTLTFSDGALTTATTGTLYVGATQLAITSAPTTAFSKHATTIVVTAKDAGGTAVANYTGTVAVTLNKISGSSSVATMTGGTSSAAAVAGVATLTPIATTSDNGLVATSYTYTAAASGLTSATTATITPTVSESIAVTIT